MNDPYYIMIECSILRKDLIKKIVNVSVGYITVGSKRQQKYL